MLRLLDARVSSHAEVRPARAGLLRVCAYVPAPAGKTDITGLRVLLAADVLARAAETRDLQALTAFVFAGEASAQAAALQRAAGALGVHLPAAHGGVREAQASLGGPIDVHLVGRRCGPRPERAGRMRGRRALAPGGRSRRGNGGRHAGRAGE